MPEITARHKAAWYRLQQLSCHHAATIGVCMGYKRQHIPPEVIRKNVEILGRGNEEEVKYRIHWYITFYPTIFQEVSRASH